MKHLNGEFNNRKLDFKKMSQLQGGEGGDQDIFKLSQNTMSQHGRRGGGVNTLRTSSSFAFFLSHPLLILKGFLEKCQVQLWIY